MKAPPDPAVLREVRDVAMDALRPLPGGACTKGIDIRPNAYESRSRSRLITVEMADLPPLDIFCKAGPGATLNAVGDPSEIDYEAYVYEQIIGPWCVPSPTFYGRIEGERSGLSYLLISWLDGFQRINKAPQPRSILTAARWLGAVHRGDAEATRQLPPGLNLYDVHMFDRWMSNALAFHPMGGPGGVMRYGNVLVELAAAEPTLVHDDCYPENALIRGDAVQAIDWEWAGWGAGEIDLAALTEGWGDELGRACTDAYAATRWPNGAPYDFALMVVRARLYLATRWLGGRPDRSEDPQTKAYLETVQETVAAFGDSR